MESTLQEIVLAAFCGAFMPGGLIWPLRVPSGAGDVDGLVASVPFMAMPLLILLTQWRQTSRFQTMTGP